MHTCPACNGDRSAYSWREPPCSLCGGSGEVDQAKFDAYHQRLDQAVQNAQPGTWVSSGINSYFVTGKKMEKLEPLEFNLFEFTSNLYKDRGEMFRFLNLVSLENMGRCLDSLLTMEMGGDYAEISDRDKLRLKQALRSMYDRHVMT